MAAEGNDFNINLGDTIYSDSEIGGSPAARTVAEKWAKYKLGLALPALRRLRASTGLYSHWDDHEFVNDFSLAENGAGDLRRRGRGVPRICAGRPRGPRQRPVPDVPLGEEPRALLPRRALVPQREGTATCDGDLAPDRAGGGARRFAALAPAPRATRCAPRCPSALDDPSRTMLGATQYAAFTKAIKASTATWKVIVNEVPIQQFYALPYDRWEGYAAERERLLHFLQANVKNVVFLTTDTHANLVERGALLDARRPARELGDLGGRDRPGRDEHVREGDRRRRSARRARGTRSARSSSSRRRRTGSGMRCAALDTYSYAEVTVTARRSRSS